jgi:hypothetical protein
MRHISAPACLGPRFEYRYGTLIMETIRSDEDIGEILRTIPVSQFQWGFTINVIHKNLQKRF